MRVVGYIRISGGPGQDTGLGLDAQRERIKNDCAARGWTLLAFEEEIASAGSGKTRPTFERLKREMAAGKYDVLMVARLDRLVRSVYDFQLVLAEAKAGDWQMVCLDPAVDMTSPYGKAMANMAATFAELERDLISIRTKEAIARVRAGGKEWGPKNVDPKTADKIKAWRRAGQSSYWIAARLNALGEYPPTAAEWTPALVRNSRAWKAGRRKTAAPAAS